MKKNNFSKFMNDNLKNMKEKNTSNMFSTLKENKKEKVKASIENVKKEKLHENIKEFINNIELSMLEEKTIFGNILENIENISMLEESVTMKVTRGNLNQANKNAIDAAKNLKPADASKMMADAKATSRQLMHQEIEDRKQEQLKDVLTNEKIIKEESAAEIKIKNDEKRLSSLNNAEERSNISFDKRKEAIRKSIENSRKVVERQKEQNMMNKTATENITESKIEFLEEFKIDPKKDRIDFDNFSETLFNGTSGNALRYFLNGEINNDNIQIIQIAKLMEAKPEVQTIIKKLKFYLRKTKSGLSYDEYIDMKVQKGKFRIEFGKAEKEYKARYQQKK